MKLKQKVAIITGGGGGIGSAITSLFIKEGARVVVADASKKNLTKLAKQNQKNRQRLIVVKADISKHSDVKKVVKKTLQEFKTIDILVNAAGIQRPIGSFIENDLDRWIQNIKVNLLGAVIFIKEVLPVMAKKRKGKIINFSGGGGTSCRPNFSAYGVAKTGIVRLTEVLGEELKPYNIQVNAVAPGAVNTAMLKEVLKAGKKAGLKELQEAKKRLKNGGTPPELAAQLVLFLASSASGKLTGRLISAVWDDWQKWNKKDIAAILKTDKFTLRRIK